MLKLIIIYEISFVLFWNILYHSNSGVENWFEEKILSAIYTVLSTMALGFAAVYVIYITAKISGLLDKVKKIRNQRENTQKQKCHEAVENMKKNKKSRKSISKTTRLLREDRIFLEELFLNADFTEMYNAVSGIFPKIEEFTKLFYRLVGSRKTGQLV